MLKKGVVIPCHERLWLLTENQNKEIDIPPSGYLQKTRTKGLVYHLVVTYRKPEQRDRYTT